MRLLLALVIATTAAACLADGTDAPSSSSPVVDALTAAERASPLALVYRGPAGCDGCSEAVAKLLRTSRYHFRVAFIGPGEARNKITAAALAGAVVYAQPGGDGTVDAAYAHLGSARGAIRDFVAGGGRYLGFCMGGYFAGSDPGFGMIDSNQWITSRGASVTTDEDTLVDVSWRGGRRTMYFQDGPYFTARSGSSGTVVLARYASNHRIAAMVSTFGTGKVAVVGPHPEAGTDWYAATGLTDPDGLDADLGQQLVEAAMQ